MVNIPQVEYQKGLVVPFTLTMVNVFKSIKNCPKVQRIIILLPA
jgi:hypothetical protein